MYAHWIRLRRSDVVLVGGERFLYFLVNVCSGQGFDSSCWIGANLVEIANFLGVFEVFCVHDGLIHRVANYHFLFKKYHKKRNFDFRPIEALAHGALQKEPCCNLGVRG